VGAETLGLLLFAVALFAVVASLYYYIAGVLDGDQLLSRSSVACVLFGVLAAVLLVRLL
jgi:hypothetical protein